MSTRRSARSEQRMSQANGPSVQELLAVIQAQTAQMQQMQEMQQQATQRQANNVQAAMAVRASGGVYGYGGGRALTEEERQFHLLLTGLGINIDTADEIFRQGIHSMEVLKGINMDKLKNVIYNVNRNRSPQCPDPSTIFVNALFENKIATLIEWIHFQGKIGAPETAVAWNSKPSAMDVTLQRTRFYKEVEASEGTDDIQLPPPLEDMTKFMDFCDHLKTYLRVKRGAAKVPLIYVIRDESTVTDADRSGTIGRSEADPYKDWDEYAIRCTVMNGTHWDHDNAAFWTVLSSLVRKGPAWDYIRSFEKNGTADGRNAYFTLRNQAFQYTNVRIIKDKARKAIRGLRYDGPSKHWNYDKYVRAWLRNIRVLKMFESCPPEDELVSDFCEQISDPRLLNGKATVLQEGSAYINSFDKTQKYFNTLLAVSKPNNQTPTRRNVSATQTGGGDSKLTTGYYPLSKWNKMSKEEKQAVRDMRDKQGTNKRKASAVSTDSPTDEAKDDAGNQFGSAAHQGKKQKKKG